MIFSDKGLDLLKQLEGFRPKPYADSGGKMTVGYGHLIVPNDGVAGAGDVISGVKASQLLVKDVARTVEGVNNAVTNNITQNQFDALVIFAYNVGVSALNNSTLMKLFNKGDIEGASNQFVRWDMAGGKHIPGLLTRRLNEKSLFLTKEV